MHTALSWGHFHIRTILQSAVTNFDVTPSDTESFVTRVSKKERSGENEEENKYAEKNNKEQKYAVVGVQLRYRQVSQDSEKMSQQYTY
jgi:hypothetical protein